MKKTLLLLDHSGKESDMLLGSLKAAGFDGPVIVCDDDGFLSEGVVSACRFFCGEYRDRPGIPGKPRYFNQINVPDYWEISGNNSNGTVKDLYRERGKIHYSGSGNKRLVKAVDWKDEKGIIRSTDYYDAFGALYSRMIYNKDGKRIIKTWFDADGCEILTENCITRDIVLNRAGKTVFFRNRTQLILKLIEELKMKDARIFYNSLSTPFFVSESLPATEEKGDVLFWQEGPRNDIPGNMLGILNGSSPRTGRIFVQKKESYKRFAELGTPTEIVRPLGFVYRYGENNKHGNQVLICTNSDNIEKLKELVEGLPNMYFHVAAITEMSQKLLNFGKYDNVSLYPGADMPLFHELFEKCDYYIDANHGGEIVSAVESAFLHNQLILAFKETMHNGDFVAQEHVFMADDYLAMIELIKKLADNAAELDRHLGIQRAASMAERPEDYKEKLNLQHN